MSLVTFLINGYVGCASRSISKISMVWHFLKTECMLSESSYVPHKWICRSSYIKLCIANNIFWLHKTMFYTKPSQVANNILGELLKYVCMYWKFKKYVYMYIYKSMNIVALQVVYVFSTSSGVDSHLHNSRLSNHDLLWNKLPKNHNPLELWFEIGKPNLNNWYTTILQGKSHI